MAQLSPKAIQGITQLTGQPPVQQPDGTWVTAQGQPIHAFGDMATVDNGNGTHTWAAGGDGIGTTVNNESIGKFLLKAAPIVAGTLIGGSLLASGGGAAAGGEAGAGYASNAAAATEAQAVIGAGAAGGAATLPGTASLWSKIGPALISSGGAIVKGAIQSNAAKNAAAQEVAAGNKALGIEKDVYDRQLSALSPYQSLGGAATGRLGELLGYPAGTGVPTAGPVAPTTDAVRGAAVTAAQQNMPQTTLPPATLQALANARGQQQTTSGYVNMASPDGSETQPVPAELAPHYASLGATYA
jgi:hypothetical protein